MAALSVARLARLPWPWRMGLGVPLVLGMILASAVTISWLTGNEYTPPEKFEAGRADAYAAGEPKLFEEDDVWVVRLEGDFLALYDRGVESGCPLQWRREFEFMGRGGWFVDTCTGSVYDLTGRCFSNDCRGRMLSRFRVSTDGGRVTVDLRSLEPEAPANTDVEPVNPPTR